MWGIVSCVIKTCGTWEFIYGSALWLTKPRFRSQHYVSCYSLLPCLPIGGVSSSLKVVRDWKMSALSLNLSRDRWDDDDDDDDDDKASCLPENDGLGNTIFSTLRLGGGVRDT